MIAVHDAGCAGLLGSDIAPLHLGGWNSASVERRGYRTPATGETGLFHRTCLLRDSSGHTSGGVASVAQFGDGTLVPRRGGSLGDSVRCHSGCLAGHRAASSDITSTHLPMGQPGARGTMMCS